MFRADFNYMTLTKKAKSHKNVLFLVSPYNTNNSIYIHNRRYRWIWIFLKQMKNKKLISQIKNLIKFCENSILQIWSKMLKSYSRENFFLWYNKIKYTCIFTIFIIGNILKIIWYVRTMRTHTTQITTSNVNDLAWMQ